MKNCLECNYHFTFIDRLKFLITGKLTCKKCKTTYKIQNTIYRFIYLLVVNLSCVFIAPIFANYEGIDLRWHYRVIIWIFITVFLITIYDLIPHKLQKYKVIK